MPEARDVKSGICRRDGDVVCGLPEEASYCDDGSWEPPFAVAHADHPHRICAYYPYAVVVGRCGTDGPCANRAERCDDPASFVERDETCSLTHDSRPSTGPDGSGAKVKWPGAGPTAGSSSPFMGWTTYGSCDGRCVWSSEDCREGEAYLRDDPRCTADKVNLGACIDGYAYCVVSEENCAAANGAREPYYTHEELLYKLDVRCYLSALPRLVAPPPPAPPAVEAGADEAPAEVQASEDAPTEARASEDGGGALSAGALVGICVGAAAVAFVAMLALQRRLQRKRRRQREWYREEEAPVPARAVALSDPHGEGEEDNVSELG